MKTIKELKDNINRRIGLIPHYQVLYYNNNIIDNDEDLLKNYGKIFTLKKKDLNKFELLVNELINFNLSKNKKRKRKFVKQKIIPPPPPPLIQELDDIDNNHYIELPQTPDTNETFTSEDMQSISPIPDSFFSSPLPPHSLFSNPPPQTPTTLPPLSPLISNTTNILSNPPTILPPPPPPISISSILLNNSTNIIDIPPPPPPPIDNSFDTELDSLAFSMINPLFDQDRLNKNIGEIYKFDIEPKTVNKIKI